MLPVGIDRPAACYNQDVFGDPSVMLASLLISTIGFAMASWGKKQKRLPQMVAGVALMAYPYVISSVWVMIGIGAGIIALLVLAVRAGA